MQSAQQTLLRQATESDCEFVYAVKKAAFSPYVKKLYGRWVEAEQRTYHNEHYAFQNVQIISARHDDVGYVSVVTESDYVRITQLMIQPKHQGKGIGEQCMALLRHEALQMKVPIHLQVMKINPRAKSFYQRIGFGVTAETETHYQMESRP